MSEAIAKFVEEVRRSIENRSFIKLTLSNYRGTEERLQRIVARPIETKKGGRVLFQFRYENRDVAKNYDAAESVARVEEVLESGFRSGHLFTAAGDFQLTIGKKSSRLVTGKPTLTQPAENSHDRTKATLIDSGAFYLKALGISTDDGKIRAQQQDKWRQINKYVEILRDLFDNSPLKERNEFKIIDMGSGKGYLTFAAHDYFSNVRALKVEVTGVEVRKELVDLCNDIALAGGVDGLSFVTGTIDEYDVPAVDILIALHACDTATDDAIFKGIASHASIIMAAPCCHKEIRRQIRPPELLRDVLKHGSLLEREAETVTDGLRGMLMEMSGYSVKVFEFVPTEHTPKNNMIVGVRTAINKSDPGELRKRIAAVKSFYSIDKHRLENLLA
ncbi:MAG TPA: SAM-dependent methyltransferase [Pyrinomonadaceae bacterium]|nr:SAM-dependent methyltransferase [Pyrinomonadaceae bacterium]